MLRHIFSKLRVEKQLHVDPIKKIQPGPTIFQRPSGLDPRHEDQVGYLGLHHIHADYEQSYGEVDLEIQLYQEKRGGLV